MYENNVSPLDVIRVYHTVESLKKQDLYDLTTYRVIKKIEKAIRKAEKLGEKDLLNNKLDGYAPRYDNYFNSHWQLLEIPLSECGCWPDIGGLKGFSNSLLPETAEKIQKVLENPASIKYKYRKVLYIKELTNVSSILNRYFPIIVMTDGVIRANRFNKTRNDVYSPATYDIEDGNHRAISHWLNGNKTITAFVGTRIYKSPYLYY